MPANFLVLARLRFALPLVALLAACGGSGSYELTWTLGCDRLGEPACVITRVRQCSAVGVDTVAVAARLEGASDETGMSFACFSGDGPVGRGPGLAGGKTELEVTGLSAGGQTVSGPVTVTVTIPDDGQVPVRVDLPLPVACRDGADNDGDGLVDQLDPGCGSEDDEDEAE